MIAGDFNSSLRPSPPFVGGVVPAGTSKQKPVQQQFQKFLHRNSLVALNTWQGRKANTYTSPQGSSQIDFLLTTKYYAAQLARKVHVIQDFKLGAWRKGGRLKPLITAIPLKKVWRHPLSCKLQPAVPSKQKIILAHHVRQGTSSAQKLEEHVDKEVRQLREQQNGAPLHPDEVNQILLEHAKTFQSHEQEDSRTSVAPTAQPLWQLHSQRQTALRNLKREDDPISKMARSEHLKQTQRSLDEAAKEHANQVKTRSKPEPELIKLFKKYRRRLKRTHMRHTAR